MLKDIMEVRPLQGGRLYLRFEDGIAGGVDLSAIVPFEGVFAELRRREVFEAVSVDPELGAIRWPNGADLDPDVLYALVSGQPVPGPGRDHRSCEKVES